MVQGADQGESSSAMIAMMAGQSLTGSDSSRETYEPELTVSDYPEEIRATDDENEDDGVDSVVPPSTNRRRGGRSGGVETRPAKKKRTQRVNPQQSRPAKKKGTQRLTPLQTQQLDGCFTICAHPDDNYRKQLSKITGLGELQVKFWFQNRRTQVKHAREKEENYRLKVENEMLKEENTNLKQARRTTHFPPSVGSSSAHNPFALEMEKLKQHNEWLQNEVSRLQSSTSNPSFQLDMSAGNVAVRQNDTGSIAEIAKNAMDELVILVESDGLWLSVPGGALEVLNTMAYAQAFPGNNIEGFKTESTRAESVVMMDIKNIVDCLMNADSFRSFCPGIVRDAKVINVYKLPTNAGYGTMQLMTIDLVFPSPLVPSRKYSFVRYCRELQKGGVVVVDVSLEESDGPFLKCSKLPSGVVIKPLKSNNCKVTAIEHVRVDDTFVGQLYQPCLSGLMFGAGRWLTSLARQYARMRDVFPVNVPGKKNLMMLADSLLVNYAGGMACNPEDRWEVLRGAGAADEIKVAFKRQRNDIRTAVLSVSVSFRLPLSLRVTFDLLKNNMLRPKWDVLVKGGVVKEELCVANGVGPDDAISVVHVKQAGKDDTIVILQNSCYDVSGSFMVYSPIDDQLVSKITSPGDLSESDMSIYPTGFFLLPDGEALQVAADFGKSGGTLLTVGFQILIKIGTDNELDSKSVSAGAVRLMSQNIATIKSTLLNSHPIFYGTSPSPNYI